MSSLDKIVLVEKAQVDAALEALGLSRDVVREVALAAAAARSEAELIDALSFPGSQSYFYGLRAIRRLLLPRNAGWRICRARNVEATVNDQLGVQLCFQNVDRACTPVDPIAVSGKGAGARELVRDGQPDLFDQLPKAKAYPLGKSPVMWYLCVSADESSVQAEVSCPEIFDGDQFCGFVKRIFVVSEVVEFQGFKRRDDEDGEPDIDVPVSRK